VEKNKTSDGSQEEKVSREGRRGRRSDDESCQAAKSSLITSHPQGSREGKRNGIVRGKIKRENREGGEGVSQIIYKPHLGT